MGKAFAHRDGLVQVRDTLLERALRLQVVRVLVLAKRLGLRTKQRETAGGRAKRLEAETRRDLGNSQNTLNAFPLLASRRRDTPTFIRF